MAPSALLLLGGILSVWSWARWPDPLVDFGRELYVAWRLSEGAVLYRDVAWLNGPLSPYFNSVIFRIFGVHLLTLVFTNLAILALFVAVAYRLLRFIVTRRTATIAMSVFLLVSAFSQMVGIGNYNFVCPYSHEITHGLFLAFVSAFLFHCSMVSRQLGLSFLGGVSVGLAFLTKPETALAAGVVALAYVAFGEDPSRGRGRRLNVGGAVLAGALVAPVAATVLLASHFPVDEALRHLLTPWTVARDARVWNLLFYRVSSGFDQPFARMLTLLGSAATYVAYAATVLVASLAVHPRTARIWSVPAGFAVFGLLLGCARDIPWHESAAGLPAVALAAVAVGACALRRPNRQTGPLLIALGLMSLALLAKIPLASRTYHYGFALAVPATLLLVVFVLEGLPALTARFGRPRDLALAVGTAVLGLWSLYHVAVTRSAFSLKTTTVGVGGDQFRADARGAVLQDCLRWANGHLPPSARVAVLPEGAMLNYLARRSSSIPYVTLMPLEVLVFGEERILDTLVAAPPDAVILVHKDTTEYGYPLFGRDYGATLLAWVRAHYQRAFLTGHAPLEDPQEFGAEVLVKNRAAP